MKIMGIAVGILVVCLLFPGAIFLCQSHLLYFPSRVTLEQISRPGLRAWPSPADFRGLIGEPTGAARATAIVFLGNAGHAGDRTFYVRTLTPLGFRVILAEYPGYGPRAGEVGEARFVADAEETVVLAHREYGGPMILVGESLGAGVAAAVAARQSTVIAGLLLITPWDRLESVASHHYPWLPVKWMLRDRYDSVLHLEHFDRPVVVAVAEQDRIVPARFGIGLHASLHGPKRLMVIRGSDHNDWPIRTDADWWRDATEFILQL